MLVPFRAVQALPRGTMNVTKLTFSVAEAAAALGVGRTGVYQLIKDGQLPKLKVGSRTLIPRGALDAFVDSATVKATEHVSDTTDPRAA